MEENNNKKEFVPAYARKEAEKNIDSADKKTNKVKSKIKNNIMKSKFSKIILIVVAVILVLVVAFGIYKLIINNSNKSNVNYLENIKTYGFDVMYDNNTAEPTDTVTKSELMKMVVVSMLNNSDITKLVEIREYIENYNEEMTQEQIEESLEYKNQMWVDYAVLSGVIEKGVITKDNANDKATLLDALVYFSNAKVKLLNEVLDTENTPDIKNFDSYRVSEQLALRDMTYNKMIDEKEKNFKQTLTKERLNKLIIDMALEYNTITVGDEKININKDKEPSNVEDYPYTLASIDKTVYELKNYIANDSYKNARDMYVDLKDNYYAISSLIEEYALAILNIDYATLDEEVLKDNLLDLSFYYENEANIKEYIEYIKSNKIKISGSAKVQFPAVYFDGELYRVRVKVDYKIENADKKENLIYGDLKSKEAISYDKDENSMIVDIPLQKSVISDTFYIKLRPLKNVEAGNVKSDSESLKEENVNTTVKNTDEIKYSESESYEDENGNVIVITK